MIITHHALQRFRERIADLPDAAIQAVLDCPATRAAIAFGAPYVRLASGHRVVIRDGAVVTVLPAKTNVAGLGRRWWPNGRSEM